MQISRKVELFLLLLLIGRNMTTCTALEMKIHGNVTIGPKWQIVIPKDVRTLIGVKPWDDMVMITKFGKAIGMIKSDDVQEFLNYMKSEMQIENS